MKKKLLEKRFECWSFNGEKLLGKHETFTNLKDAKKFKRIKDLKYKLDGASYMSIMIVCVKEYKCIIHERG